MTCTGQHNVPIPQVLRRSGTAFAAADFIQWATKVDMQKSKTVSDGR